MAADTRVTLTSGADSREAYFDNSSKLLTVGGSHNRVAAVAYGAGSVSGRMVSGLMSEFQQTIGDARLSTLEYAKQFSQFFDQQWNLGGNTSNIWFLVGGVDDNAPYGDLYSFMIPNGELTPNFPGSTFGIRWGGQSEIAHRIILGYDQRLSSFVPDVDPVLYWERPNRQTSNENSLCIVVLARLRQPRHRAHPNHYDDSKFVTRIKGSWRHYRGTGHYP